MGDEISEDIITRLTRLETKVDMILCNAKDCKKNYVTRREFFPVRLIAFGLMGVLGTSTVLAVVAHVIGQS